MYRRKVGIAYSVISTELVGVTEFMLSKKYKITKRIQQYLKSDNWISNALLGKNE